MDEHTSEDAHMPAPVVKIKPFYKSRSFIIFLFPFVLLFAISVLLLIFVMVSGKSAGGICSITQKNLCDGKIVEIKGVVNDPNFIPELGYKFVPTNVSVKNEVYLAGVRYGGVKVGAGPENFVPQPPFGSTITVRGRVVVNDQYRCTVKEYATANQQYCNQESFRVMISPISVIGDVGENKTYGIFGEFQSPTKDLASCVPTKFCEGLDQQTGKCHTVQLGENQCSQIAPNFSMFYISGTSKSLSESLRPDTVFEVDSVDYGNNSDQTVSGANKYFLTGGYAVYNIKGEKMVTLDLGNTYINHENIIPIPPDGVYILDKSVLYFVNPKDGKTSKIGEIPSQYMDSDDEILGRQLINSDKDLLILTAKSDDERVVNGNSYRTNTVNILKLPLNPSGSKPELVYSETLEGLLQFLAYDPASNGLIVSYYSSEEMFSNCRTTHYAWVNLLTKTKKEMFSYVTDGDKYCTQEIYREVYTSPNGQYMVFAGDFNNNPAVTPINKLIVYQINRGNPTKKEYPADALVRNDNLKITDIKNNSMSLVDASYPDIFYKFNLTKDKYSFTNFTPAFPSAPTTTPVSYPIIYGAKYIFEDSKNWYFMLTDATESKYYIIDKKTKQPFLTDTFSTIVRPIVIKGKLYLVDTDH